jgi:hypothetical protein
LPMACVCSGGAERPILAFTQKGLQSTVIDK